MNSGELRVMLEKYPYPVRVALIQMVSPLWWIRWYTVLKLHCGKETASEKAETYTLVNELLTKM